MRTPWFLLLLALVSGVAQAALRPDEFAYLMTVRLQEDAPLQSVLLPPHVYLHTVRPDLGDLRLFTPAGEIVPHVLRRCSPPAEEPLQPVAFFPVEALEDGRPGEIDIQTDGRGTIIRVNADHPGPAASIHHLLVDVSGIDRPLTMLRVGWEAEAGFTLPLAVERSDDLAHWKPLVAEAVIADHRHMGHRLVRDTIELPGVEAKYLRLLFKVPSTLRVTAIEGRTADTVRRPPRYWQVFGGERVRGKEWCFEYDILGRLPGEFVDLELADNQVLPVLLESRPADTGPWRFRHRGTFYNLEAGGRTLRSQPVRIPAGDRFWRLTVLEAEGASMTAPQLRIGWHAERLLFFTPRTSEIQLAYGHAGIAPSAGSIAPLVTQVEKDYAVAQSAVLGPPVAMQGAAALVRQEAWPWKKFLLWGILVGGVMLLGWCAWRLQRQMR